MAAAFFLQVSPTSGVPIYRQLLDQIRAQVASGRLAPDEFLPSVRQLAQQLQAECQDQIAKMTSWVRDAEPSSSRPAAKSTGRR